MIKNYVVFQDGALLQGCILVLTCETATKVACGVAVWA